MIGMVDIKERLNEEKQLEDLREKVRARRKDLNEITVQLTHGRTRRRWLASSSTRSKLRGVCQIICILRGVGRAQVTCTEHVLCKISS